MLVTCCAEQRTQGRSWLNQELKGWPRKRVLKRNPQSECCVTSVMSGAMSLAMMPVGCQVARSKQRAKGGKPETRVDENPKQKPRRTKRGTLSAREAQNEQGFWRAEEEEEERTERGSTRKRKGSRLAGGHSDGGFEWPGEQEKREPGRCLDGDGVPACAASVASRITDGIGAQARMEKRDTPGRVQGR